MIHEQEPAAGLSACNASEPVKRRGSVLSSQRLLLRSRGRCRLQLAKWWLLLCSAIGEHASRMTDLFLKGFGISDLRGYEVGWRVTIGFDDPEIPEAGSIKITRYQAVSIEDNEAGSIHYRVAELCTG